jgi:hypothetical protein
MCLERLSKATASAWCGLSECGLPPPPPSVGAGHLLRLPEENICKLRLLETFVQYVTISGYLLESP